MKKKRRKTKHYVILSNGLKMSSVDGAMVSYSQPSILRSLFIKCEMALPWLLLKNNSYNVIGFARHFQPFTIVLVLSEGFFSA